MYYAEFKFVPQAYGSVYVNAETISELISEMRKLGFRRSIAETDIIDWFRKNNSPYVSECLIVRNIV